MTSFSLAFFEVLDIVEKTLMPYLNNEDILSQIHVLFMQNNENLIFLPDLDMISIKIKTQVAWRHRLK